MTADALKRIALQYGWQPEDWHFKLAERIPAMAVYGIFRTAVLRDGFSWFGEYTGAKYLELQDEFLRERAKPYLRDLAMALQCPVHVAEKPARQPGPVPEMSQTDEIELAKKRHQVRRSERGRGREEGYTMSQDHKRKISESLRKRSAEGRGPVSGFRHSDETKQKMREAALKRQAEGRGWVPGARHTPEARERMREAALKRQAEGRGRVPGARHTPEARERIREAARKRHEERRQRSGITGTLKLTEREETRG